MTNSTPNLALPYLTPSQSDKHVSVNQSLGVIDALLMCHVEGMDQDVPPSAPLEGQRWIVGQVPTGAWAGQAGRLAVWALGGWSFHVPQAGWLILCRRGLGVHVHDGTGWTRLVSHVCAAGTTGQNVFLGPLSGPMGLSGTGSEGSRNVSVGQAALTDLSSGSENSAMGHSALKSVSTGLRNTAMGFAAGFSTTVGEGNSALGLQSLFANQTGAWNTALGAYALLYRTDGTSNTNFSNCVGLGTDTRVSASNQVQLGNSLTSVYAYGAVQVRSDPRDKADMRPTCLGLSFILALEPIDFRWNYREDYLAGPASADPAPAEPGSRKRRRFHHGLNAEQVHAAMTRLGVDFGGYQDHARSGGADVKSIGYEELIAPLIKSVQELHARIEALDMLVRDNRPEEQDACKLIQSE